MREHVLAFTTTRRASRPDTIVAKLTLPFRFLQTFATLAKRVAERAERIA